MFEPLSLLDRMTLAAPTAYWDDGLPREQSDAIVRDVLDAFYNWQSRQADAAGKVHVVRGGAGLLSLPTSELVGVDEVEPWQCAGPFVHNDIDLAFRLFGDDDPAFMRVIEQHGLGLVFAVIASWSMRTAEQTSLVRLNGFLVGLLIGEARGQRKIGRELFDELKAHGRKRKEGKERLAAAREVSARARREGAARDLASLRTMAHEYLTANPRALQADVIAYLGEFFPKLEPKTIKRKIAGVITEVRRARLPRPDLYATVHKSNR